MRILVSNDDGVHAPGIKALAKSLSRIAEVVIVAPLEERSSTGHGLSLHAPLRLVEIEENIYGCSGYPADCTLFGLSHVLRGKSVDLVVTGINRGANLGQDIYYSGTAAAAREAVFRGVPGIAVSTVTDNKPGSDPQHYETAGELVTRLVEREAHLKLDKNWMLNVNVPDLPLSKLAGVRVTKLGFRYYTDEIITRSDNRGHPYYWIGGGYSDFERIPDTDCLAAHEGFASISPLNLLGQNTDIPNEWSDESEFLRNLI